MIYFEDLIGKPFTYGGRGSESYDCYGLVIEMLNRIGISPEDYGWSDKSAAIQAMMLSASQQSVWTKVAPQKNAVALFRTGRFVRHVGFFINPIQFIHCWERSGGVVIETFSEDWSKRLVGCYLHESK